MDPILPKSVAGIHDKLCSSKIVEKSFLKDPSGWLKAYVKDWKFATDDDYMDCVSELLEQDEDRSLCLRDSICPPIWIAAALVTEDHLNQLKNPMRSSIILEIVIREHAKRSDKLYLQHYQRLLKVPSEFSMTLLDECLSPKEVGELMTIQDISILDYLRRAKKRTIVENPFYSSLYKEKFFWREPGLGYSPSLLKGLCRLIFLILWNILYLPTEVLKQLCKCVPYNFHNRLFSPVSFLLADMTNYIILTSLVFAVVMTSEPNPKATRDLIKQLKAGEITIEHSRLINGSDGIVQVELEKSPISPTECALLASIISRVLSELYQLLNNDISASSDKGRRVPSLYKKIRLYLNKDMNKIDCLLLASLVCAFGSKLHYVYKTPVVYGSVCMKDNGCEDDGIDYSLEARRIVYMIHFYSLAGLLTLVRMFYSIFLFVPIIGPIIRSIQMMLKDVGRVVLILLFFSIGFFVPLYAIIKCYLAIQPESIVEGEDDNEAFKTMSSPGFGIFTMILSMLGGQLTYADDVYSSKDNATNVFLSIILITFSILFGLLCLNLLIGLICKRYDQMLQHKNRDWRYAQFDLFMGYNALTPENGMPFFFPLCIVHMIWCFGRMIVEGLLCKKSIKMGGLIMNVEKKESKKKELKDDDTELGIPKDRISFASQLLERRDNRLKTCCCVHVDNTN